MASMAVNTEESFYNFIKSNTPQKYSILVEQPFAIVRHTHFLNDMELAVAAIHHGRAACASRKKVGKTIKFKDKVYRVVIKMSDHILCGFWVVIPSKYKIQYQQKSGLANSVAAIRTAKDDVKPRPEILRLSFKLLACYPL